MACMAGLVLGVTLGRAAPAHAQDLDEEEVGEDPTLPEPPAAGHELPADDDGRRSIRGGRRAPAHETVSPAEAAERAWEAQTFPQVAVVSPPPDPAAELPPPVLPPELTPVAPRPVPPALVPPRPTDRPWLAGVVTGDLPVRWDERVLKYLDFYKSDPRGRVLMTAWLERQARFAPIIMAAIHRHHLPEDLIYVCMIESAYDPVTRSGPGAAGLWQFMPGAARVYGLRIDYWLDERRDPEKSSEAAMLYWEDLYARFGDWHLALAAYNAGYGAILRAIARFNTNDFWTLLDLENGLPWAATIYVPKAIAAAIVGRNRAAFGYDSLQPAPPWTFDRVTVDGSVSLAVVARATGASLDDIKALNPALKRGRTPPGERGFELRIPQGSRDRFAKAFPAARAELDDVDTYVIRHGERFEDVATTFGVSPRTLRELNGLEALAELRGGTLIVVPRIDHASFERNRAKAEDSLYHAGIAPGEPGEPMIVPLPDKELEVEGKQRVFYRVVAGDSLSEIADALDVRIADLRRWNRLGDGAQLQPRMVLQAFVSTKLDAEARHVALLDPTRLFLVTAGSAEHLDLVEGRKGRVRKIVTAQAGETLEGLGRTYRLSKYEMARINRKSPGATLDAGEQILVYAIVDAKKAHAAGVDRYKGSKAHARRAKPGKAKAKAKAKPGKIASKPAPAATKTKKMKKKTK
jgi:membrane-bound lytic murein transglycosylase D